MWMMDIHHALIRKGTLRHWFLPFLNPICSSMAGRRILAYVLFILMFNSLSTKQAHEMQTIPQGQQLNKRHILISVSNPFKSLFFKSNGLSLKSHYFEIWSIKDPYRKLMNTPMNDSWGVLNADINGKFKTLSSERELIVLGFHQQANGSHVSVTLLDSGNLILRAMNSNGSMRWVLSQRFDYILPLIFMPWKNVGINFDTGSGDIGSSEIPSCRTGNEVFQRKRGGFDFTTLQLYTFSDPNLDLTDCEALCWFHCDCSVYVQQNGTKCSYWVGELNFVESNSSSEEFYVLPSKSGSKDPNNTDSTHGIPPSANQPSTTHPIGTRKKDEKGSNIKRWWWIWSPVAFGLPVTMLLHGLMYHSRAKSLEPPKGLNDENASQEKLSLLEMGTAFKLSHKFKSAGKLDEGDKLGDLYSFSYEGISAATNNFSPSNKLGEGGFGPVFKGILHNGQEIAVKKLSRSSSQGLVEFKNEIMLIAKLQHTNLVRLLGSCVQGEEKMLVYEFMPNNSLDTFLFDPTKRETLNWKRRRVIIEGIAQGLLYLHKYSRFRVIHRDLKASNILLDNEMNPKISDFGMARIFKTTESEASTKRIVGTYGYMSPEYAMEGIFSEKSDVFSFGVLLIEIISGKKNTAFCIDYSLNLVGYAWKLWKEGKILELIDQTLSDSCSRNQLQKCIHVSLLCVQEIPADRPTMSDVVSMLTNETMPLPTPNQPPFCFGRSERVLELSYGNVVTISTLESR